MKIYLSSPIAMLCGCKVKRILSNSLYLAQCVGSYDVKKIPQSCTVMHYYTGCLRKKLPLEFF